MKLNDIGTQQMAYDEDPSLRIESFAIINLLCVFMYKAKLGIVFALQTYKKLSTRCIQQIKAYLIKGPVTLCNFLGNLQRNSTLKGELQSQNKLVLNLRSYVY